MTRLSVNRAITLHQVYKTATRFLPSGDNCLNRTPYKPHKNTLFPAREYITRANKAIASPGVAGNSRFSEINSPVKCIGTHSLSGCIPPSSSKRIKPDRD
ncbi:hypothetical protein AVEN_180901-1 [Araneus ventricosus]|uniref:Uncharacterized protein n=1 Tax=Araneus ventricosus TaxID=182803 RepID=A0A4Y2LXI8_ARAVE|nr:hypothetical protein AVEN_100609-1 [Araneus ventricosus]GBN19179.1 hypothetical protein AVEN_180901-1 [Araneus ventricosus]